jgi:hypothetical protein
MAITNNLGQTRVGVRVPLSVVIPTQSALLDSYSGAAAAFSLRKLTSTYTGSAIRVRRSSDNTEMDIGFDAVGNLDTVALSQFVGSGSGFVKTWYDQSGNYRNVAQTTAANQPRIINSGSLELLNNKVCVSNYGQNQWLQLNSFGSNIASIFSFAMVGSFGNDSFRVALKFNPPSSGNNTKLQVNGFASLTSLEMQGGSSIYYAYPSVTNTTIQHIVQGTFNSANSELSVNNQTVVTGNAGGSTLNGIIIGADWAGSYPTSGKYQEVVVWGVNKSTDRGVINTALNSYYSIYPNPTSVWNLLTAVYSSDTTAQSSLKTSLVASYNGESNTNDSFGTNHGTSVGGLTYGAGKIGTAFVGNGTTSYIEVGDKLDLGLSSWSYSIWFYPTNLSFNRTLFSKIAWAAGGGRFALTISSALITFDLVLSNGDYIAIRDNSTVLPGSQWSNLTVVIDRNDKVKLYYNGVLSTNVVNLGTVNNNLIPYINDNLNNTRPFRIGCFSGTDGYNPETPTNFAQGRIDSFNVWNKALTQSEITELYNSGNGAQYIGDNFYKPTTNDALGINNGTAQGGLTYAPGKIGTAFQFNGTNASVRFPAGSMNFTGDFSISGWVNLSSVYNGTYEATLIVNVTAPSWFTNPKGFWVSIAGNSVIFDLWNGTTGVRCSWDDSTGSIVKANSGWIHIVATRKSSTGSKLYVNGVLKNSNTSTINPTYDPVYQTPNMGSRYILNSSGSVVNSSVFAPDGTKMDGLSVWQKELTQSEITELYNSGNGKQYPF